MSNVAVIKQRLLERKQELEEIISRLDKDRLTVTETAQDPVDQAVLSGLEDLNISIQKNERDEYLMILKALEMIDAGTYGVCIDCGLPISEKRLLMYPNATRCIACQEMYESD